MSRLTGKDAWGMFEAYQAVYAPQVDQVDEPQEEIDEALTGERIKKVIRKPGGTNYTRMHSADPKKRPTKRGGWGERGSAKQSDFSAADRGAGNKAARRAGRDVYDTRYEELDIFDVVLEFLQAEGYAETLEEAEWMMANVIDEEAIDIILGEASRRDEFTRAAIARNSGRKGGITFEPGPNWDPSANRGRGAHLNPKQKEKQRRKALRQEEYVDEAQEARNNPEKYEREQDKKYAPVRGERTPMPPRGNKRREDFEKWYAANVR